MPVSGSRPCADLTANQEQISTQLPQRTSSLLNLRVVAAAATASTNEGRTPEIQLYHQLEDHRQPILELLNQYCWKSDELVEDLQTQCDRDVTLCTLAASFSRSLSANIRMIQLVTSLRDLRQILDKLQNVVLDITARVQNIVSPPLLTKFINLRTDIVLKLSTSAFDRSRLLVHKDEILNRIEKIISDTEEAKGASPGQLPPQFIRRLEWGHDNRKNYLLLAKLNIQDAKNNETIERALHALAKSIARGDRTLKSVLRSPQRNFEEKAFAFLGKLYALRHKLGETVNPEPHSTTRKN
ncbi:MAG: hypothetical protein C5B47_01660 [Verrucomicrobia bacterium]|nr:MAG: hypothetical protein C5B47_01660 [Verrucomicrobiota bacterium]